MCEIEKSLFQEAILGRTPSDAYQKEGLPAETLMTFVIRTEEFKR